MHTNAVRLILGVPSTEDSDCMSDFPDMTVSNQHFCVSFSSSLPVSPTTSCDSEYLYYSGVFLSCILSVVAAATDSDSSRLAPAF